jgi:polysaccharide export outer membrane protein
LQYGIIRRKNKDGTYSCLAFKPQDLVSAKPIPVQLQSQDLVYFFTRDKESREELLAGLLSDLRNQTISGRFAKIVRVSGSVHFPGEYPLTDSMNLSDLFHAGGGAKDSAYMLDAEISRVVVGPDQTATVKHIRLNPKVLADSNTSKTIQIHPYDILSIKAIPLWREGESVTLSGEFRFPGTYSIKPGETLVDIVNRAGGLTERAFPKGAVFSRENLRETEDQQRERLISQLESDLATATLAASDSEDALQTSSAANAMLSRLKNAESKGRLVINLDELIRNPSQSDILVLDGDTLTVPQIPYAVSVSGEVQFPSSHMHEKNLQLDDYLNRSGGFTQNADKDRTFVVKANGSVMSKRGNAWFGKGISGDKIDPGDVIVVPIDLKQTKFLENLTYGTQIIYQLAVAAAAVNSF